MTPPPLRPLGRILSAGSRLETARLTELLRRETVGGLILVGAAAAAMIWANSPAGDSYFWLRELHLGPAALHLDLSVGAWAADGLLAVFFFLVGLELKHEFLDGDLRDPGRAAVPVAAAFGGVLVPAAIYLLANRDNPAGLAGWAIPAATDIAFGLAVLAIIGSKLPSALRIFLLTLAVVDDLIAILIIAAVYTADLHSAPLLLALIPAAVFGLAVQRWSRWFTRTPWALWLILLPLGVVTWALVHASGLHATLAGVALGLLVPVRRRPDSHEDEPELEAVLDRTVRPLSAGFAVPLFALFASGVRLGDWAAFTGALADPIALGTIAGLVIGKPIGILVTTWAVTRFTRAELDESLAWIDLVGVGMLAGIGFTVSLLIGELSFGSGSQGHERATLAVLVGSLTAALLATIVLRARNRHYADA